METLNYTEEQTLEMFNLMADAEEARKAKEHAYLKLQEAQKEQERTSKRYYAIVIEINRINEQTKLNDCPYTKGQKFIVNHEIYDQIKIDYLTAWGGGEIDIHMRGRRKTTKGWEGTKHTTVEAITGMIICEL